MRAFFSRLLPNHLILVSDDAYWAIAMTGNNDWAKRKRVYLHTNQLHHELTGNEYKLFKNSYFPDA